MEGFGIMVDKPIIRKPVQKAENVAQPMDLTHFNDKPIAQQSGDNWHIAVFPHPIVKSRFSYTLIIGRRIRANPSPIDEDHPNLFGCFATPAEAIEAGLEEIQVE